MSTLDPKLTSTSGSFRELYVPPSNSELLLNRCFGHEYLTGKQNVLLWRQKNLV